MTDTVYIGLGANLGDRIGTLRSALRRLSAAGTVNIGAVSGAWESTPVGPVAQGDYLNAAAEIHTDLEPMALLHGMLDVERQHGRRRLVRWGPRTLDLDILLWGSRCIDEPGLKVPHPWMDQRLFVLEPLLEIAPDLRHPALAVPLSEQLQVLRGLGQESVRRVADLTDPGAT